MAITDEGYKEYLKGERKGEVGQTLKNLEKFYIKGTRAPLGKRVPSRLAGKGTSAKLRKGILRLAGRQPITSRTGKRVKSGRGRPSGTYKTRYVPGVGPVKVPTHIYRKMLSASKAKMRLALAQQKAMTQQQMEAEQLAMSQDPRFQQDGDEEFLEGLDPIHEQRVADIRQQQVVSEQIAKQRQFARSQPERRIVRSILLGRQQGYPQQDYPQRGVPTQNIQQQRFQQSQQPRPPLNFISERSSILNTPGIFDRPGGSSLISNLGRRV